MANRVLTQVPVTDKEIVRVVIEPRNSDWVVAVTYLVKEVTGAPIGNAHVVTWTPGINAQATVADFIRNQCVPRANTQEGT